MVQKVKYPALSLQWPGVVVAVAPVHLWPGNFHMPQVQPKKKKKNKPNTKKQDKKECHQWSRTFQKSQKGRN